MTLESIPVEVTGSATEVPEAVLVEVAGLLEQLASRGVSGAVDLRSLPMSDDDRRRLEDRLGRGEVSARVDVAGLTEVWETSYAGVWWVRHHDAQGRVASEQIAVTRIPEILMSPEADVREAADRILAHQ